MKKPSEYKKRILLAVSGKTPQVVTETLYALARNADDPFVPTEVHLLTTTEGADRAKLLLLSADPGWFHQLCEEHNLRGVAFPEQNIHLLCEGDGKPLNDILTAEDNQWAADGITEQVRLMTSDPECALHVSMAGGRKTMGFYAAYALSLFGRPQDSLSHVLVQSDYEFAKDFFYPSVNRRVIEGRDKKPLDAAEAQVMLADIPFVRMRHGLPDLLLEGESSYSEVVKAANAALGPAELVIDQPRCRIRAGGKVFAMRKPAVALLSVFARRAMEGKGPVNAPAKLNQYPPSKYLWAQWAKSFRAELDLCAEEERDWNDKTLEALEGGMNGEFFSMQLSRLQATLRKILGPGAAPYLIDNGRTRPGRFRLNLPPESIHIAPLPAPEEARKGSKRRRGVAAPVASQ